MIKFLISNILQKNINLLDRYIFGGNLAYANKIIKQFILLPWSVLMYFLSADDPRKNRQAEIKSEPDVINMNVVYGSRWVNTALISCSRKDYHNRVYTVTYLICNNLICGIEAEFMVRFAGKNIKVNLANRRKPRVIAMPSGRNKFIYGVLTNVEVQTDLQGRDSDLLTSRNEYSGHGIFASTINDKSGASYLRCTFKFSSDIDPDDLHRIIFPQITVKTINSLLLHPHMNRYTVSNNSALCVFDFLINILDIPITMIDVNSFVKAVQVCHSRKSLHGSYTCDAAIVLEDDPLPSLSHLLHTMLGDLYMEDGRVWLRAGSPYLKSDVNHVVSKNLCNEGVQIQHMADDVVDPDFSIHASYLDEDMNMVELPELYCAFSEFDNIDKKPILNQSTHLDLYSETVDPDSKNLPDMRPTSYNLEKYNIDENERQYHWEKWFLPKERPVTRRHFNLFLPFISNKKQALLIACYYARILLFHKYKFYIDLRLDEHKFYFAEIYQIRLPFFSKDYNFSMEAKEYDIDSHSVRLTLRLDHPDIWLPFDESHFHNTQDKIDHGLKLDLSDLFPAKSVPEIVELLQLGQRNKSSAYYDADVEIRYSDMYRKRFIDHRFVTDDFLRREAELAEKDLAAAAAIIAESDKDNPESDDE